MKNDARNGWSDERRAALSKLNHQFKPWTRSTGPRSVAGKAIVAQNSYRGALRENRRAGLRFANEIGKTRQRLDLLLSICEWTRRRIAAGLSYGADDLQLAIANKALPPASAWQDADSGVSAATQST